MIKTLQKKFIITAMTAITILLVVLLGVINTVNVWTTSKEADSMLTFLSNRMAQGWQNPNRYTEHRGFWGRTFTEDDVMSAVYFIVRFDADGETERVDVSRISSVTEDEAKEIALQVYGKETSGNIEKFKYSGTSLAYTGGMVYVFLDTSSEYLSIARIIGLSLVTGLVCWGLMLLLVIFLSKKAIRPIAENIQKQQQFVTDAGHEIKTPLAIILANTDALELHNGESKWSKNIRSQVNRLNGLMQNLLTLARADEEKRIVNPEHLDLSELLENSIASFEEPMRAKRLVLQKDIDSSTGICANKEQISNLLSVLLDNAVKYSVPGGTVAIDLSNRENCVELNIENDCEELPPCEPSQLFDRFYRADTARTQKNGGYGIGLSAAKAIVESYHGDINARYLSEDRIAFTVRFQK